MADIIGDEIIEWNGRALHNKTADQVYDILDESRLDAQVEIIVSRPIHSNNLGSSADSSSSVSPASSATSSRKSTISNLAASAVVSSGGRCIPRKGISFIH